MALKPLILTDDDRAGVTVTFNVNRFEVFHRAGWMMTAALDKADLKAQLAQLRITGATFDAAAQRVYLRSNPAHTFKIKLDRCVFSLAEPIEGKWYCGFDTGVDAATGEEFERDGAIGKYVGDGEFQDEDGSTLDMGGYSYLVQQA